MTEFDFRTQNCHLGEAKLTGKIDRLKVDEENKKVSVCDYKTGKHIYDWNSSNSHQQIKIWKYRNQLLFYKLLVESSRSFAGKYQVDRAVLEFVDPQNQENHLLNLDLSGITKEELNEFKKLVEVVYRRITTLDFPETEHYSPDIVGIQHLITDLTQ
jgi:DNA helicase-2/ATP-dependent DNA helicase PcrA